ncbi:MAG: hypothetical protein AAB597_01575 [Patescibacteria group bacterium]
MAEERKPEGLDLFTFALLALAVLFGLWYLSGGPAKFAARAGTGAETSSATSSSKFGLFSFVPVIPRFSLPPPPGVEGGFGSDFGGSDFTSPLGGNFALETGTAGGALKADNEYLRIRISPRAPKNILLTGFELRSTASGRGAAIPEGVPLPFTNQVNEKDPIFVNPSDTIYVNSGRSPVGYSFRVNKCSGYFEQFQNFQPSISLQCPRIEDEELPKPPNALSDQCLSYVRGLGTCSVPTSPDTDRLPQECINFVTERSGYNKCVEKYKNDKDFYKPEWRVFLNYSDPLWRNQREVIKLLDLNKETAAGATY